MGSCSKRHLLLTVCVLQLISTVQRQVFDFLGYMWTPILLNFFNIIFVIFGFFGGYQYRPKYIITYTVWNLLWLAWNIFIICFYLSVGVLDKESSVLNLGTGSVSWWEANGPGCKAVYSLDEIDPAHQYRATSITDCVIQYEHVEIAQAAWQSLLACLGFISGVCLSRIFIEEDDSFDFMSGDGKSPRHLALQPMYVSYTSLTQSSKRNSLSNTRRPNQKPLDTLDSTYRSNVSSNSANNSNIVLISHKTTNVADRIADQFSHTESSNNYDSYDTARIHRSNSHIRLKQKALRADQIRNSQLEIPGHNISRSRSHERISRRVKNTERNTRPKSLCARTSFVDA